MSDREHVEVEFSPFDAGRLSVSQDRQRIDGTYALAQVMEGWKMAAAEVDEDGIFLNVTWVRTTPGVTIPGQPDDV